METEKEDFISLADMLKARDDKFFSRKRGFDGFNFLIAETTDCCIDNQC
jgi:hypothetical protein